MNDIFLRTRMILGDEAMERLRRSHVAVFGLGGVGSYAAEALARSEYNRQECNSHPHFLIFIPQQQTRGMNHP